MKKTNNLLNRDEEVDFIEAHSNNAEKGIMDRQKANKSKKQAGYDIYKDLDLMHQFSENIWRLFKELTSKWTTNDIKVLLSFIDSLHLSFAFKTYRELYQSPYYFIFKLNEKAELEKYIAEINTNQEKKEEIDKYLKVINEKNFIIHLKDLFPKIHNQILELEKNNKAELKMEYVNLNITQNKFAKIVKDNGYNSQFLLFLPKFRINGNEINKKAFATACSTA